LSSVESWKQNLTLVGELRLLTEFMNIKKLWLGLGYIRNWVASNSQ